MVVAKISQPVALEPRLSARYEYQHHRAYPLLNGRDIRCVIFDLTRKPISVQVRVIK
jgi:hypothetical protein